MRRFALILAIFPGVLAADEFRKLTGDEIIAALSNQKLKYGEGVWQTFSDTKLTEYYSDRPSAGRWDVRADRYCSVWPPSDLWVCYDVLQNGDVVRFVGDTGEITDGTIAR